MFGYIMVYHGSALSLSPSLSRNMVKSSRFRLTANPHEPNLDHKKKGPHHHTMGPFIAFICIYPPETSNMVGFFKSQNKPLRYGKIMENQDFLIEELVDFPARLRDHATHADSNDVHLLLGTIRGRF